MIEFADLPSRSASRLSALASEVSSVRPEAANLWSINTGSDSYTEDAEAIVNEAKSWGKPYRAFLYRFSLNSPHPEFRKLSAAFSDAKAAEKDDRAYARWNRDNESTCLYVGSSESIHTRLNQHFGLGARRTYSLQLAYWAAEISVELSIECTAYSDSISRPALQALEDTLWDLEKPMFGRQGAR